MFSTDREISLYTDMLALGQSSFFTKQKIPVYSLIYGRVKVYATGLGQYLNILVWNRDWQEPPSNF